MRNSKEKHLQILILFVEREPLLTVLKLESSSGQNQAKAVLNAIYDWNLDDKVKIICYDTTASNTGRFKEVCMLLEQKLRQGISTLLAAKTLFKIFALYALLWDWWQNDHQWDRLPQTSYCRFCSVEDYSAEHILFNGAPWKELVFRPLALLDWNLQSYLPQYSPSSKDVVYTMNYNLDICHNKSIFLFIFNLTKVMLFAASFRAKYFINYLVKLVSLLLQFQPLLISWQFV